MVQEDRNNKFLQILNLLDDLCLKPIVNCRNMGEKEGKQKRQKEMHKEGEGKMKGGKGQIKSSPVAVRPTP
jgi:hypothetical protein